jgi:hypothetical protein
MTALVLLTALAFFVPFGTGYYVGHDVGVNAERRRKERARRRA